MTWNEDVLLDVLREDHGPLDWRAVAEGLDFPECDLSKPEVRVICRCLLPVCVRCVSVHRGD